MEKQPFPKTNFPQSEYPNYFALYHDKPIVLSKVETPQLRKAVERLVEAGIAIGIPVRKKDGSKDMIVRWKEAKNR